MCWVLTLPADAQVEAASKHQALLVNVEHRFYGDSYPTADSSTANLRFLSSEQALADLARLISFLKDEYETPASKVVTFGGSYPGDLSAWFRLKYSSIAVGAVASSAPLHAVLDMSSYMDVVASATVELTGDTKCNEALAAAAAHVASLAAGGIGSAGMQQLEKDFNTCSPIASELDLSVLLSDLMGNIQGVVQYNNPNSPVNVVTICAALTAPGDSYANFVALSATFHSTCEDASWADSIAILADVAPNGNAARSWTYQTCAEFGYYQTTNSPNQPFHAWTQLNLGFSREICRAAFDGWSADPDVRWTEETYGGTAIDATNILFGSGTVDPWHSLGVTDESVMKSDSLIVAFMHGTSHCRDLYAPADTDPADVKAAHALTASAIESWLGGPAATAPKDVDRLIAATRRR